MLFPTFAFGVFFLILFCIAWAARGHNDWRKIIILVLSWVFYGAWDWRFVALLIASALINWGCAQGISLLPVGSKRRRALLVGGVCANLAILIFFKYWGFFLQEVSQTLALFGWQRDMPLMSIILPVGISFFTFQGMSYLIDVWRQKVRPARLLDVTLLMSFFAHLVAGPIVRASDLIPQFERPARISREMAATGLLLIVWGLFKKAVIASELATGLVDPVFFDPGAHGQWDLIAATYGYAVQIYCDFSAYSDMAIGLAALLGYRFPQNFNQPYRANSLQDFWRRWHMSLSSWLRDYLYIPLGGNRSGVLPPYGNLMITMLLGGLWHGANVTFLIWGGLHGGVLALERLWLQLKPKFLPELPKILGIVIIFHIVCLGWIFFRSQTFDEATAFLAGIGKADAGPVELTVTPLAVGLIVAGLATQGLPERALEAVAVRLARMPVLVAGVGLAALMVVIEALRPQGVAPFIYYQF
jgi:D-alanyl-lipoteichoic acid acyltransferase DltB (MBOAT superfamily)